MLQPEAGVMCDDPYPLVVVIHERTRFERLQEQIPVGWPPGRWRCPAFPINASRGSYPPVARFHARSLSRPNVPGVTEI